VIGEKKSRDFISATSNCCLQKQMNVELHVENVYFVVTSITPFVPTVAFSQRSCPHCSWTANVGTWLQKRSGG